MVKKSLAILLLAFFVAEAKKFEACELKELFEEKFPNAKARNQIDQRTLPRT